MPGLLAKYRPLLDLPAHTGEVTLHEGDTPLIPMPRLAAKLGGGFDLYVKYEGLNPTGSFKDRGMTAAISEAAGRGACAVICASTGNTAASAAAYAARAGLKAIVLIPQGKVAAGKLAGAAAYGAQVVQVEGSFDEALALVVEVSEKRPVALVNSINPYRLEGQKTAAFEILETLGKAPDRLCLPVGNAGNICAYWLGFRQMHDREATGLPRLLGVQAAAEESGGRIVAATDEDILAMQVLLAAEGVWVEPASAAGLAGLKNEIAAGLDVRGETIVAVCTGHGLKDPDAITRRMLAPEVVPADLGALERLLGEE